MAVFACDDSAVESLLHRLADEVVAVGGRLSTDAVISCENGNLTVQSSAADGTEDELVFVPEAALIPISQASFALQGDEIIVRSVDDEMDRTRRSLLQLMVELYNLTQKIRNFRGASPFLSLARRPEVLAHLLAGRHTRKKPPQPGTAEHDAEVVELFNKSRTLGYKFDGAPKKTPVLMPLLDSFNHHPAGAKFRPLREKDEIGLTVKTVRPLAGSNECFVSYGLRDAHDTLLHYAYVEPNAPFLRSVPCELEIAGLGRLSVRSVSGAKYDGPLAAEIRDLRMFMPLVEPEAPDHIRISHLIVPGPASKFALRRVLAEIIKLFDPAQSADMLFRRVAAAERDLLRQNIDYYRDLDRILEAGPRDASTEDPGRLATIQCARIQTYIDAVNTKGRG